MDSHFGSLCGLPCVLECDVDLGGLSLGRMLEIWFDGNRPNILHVATSLSLALSCLLTCGYVVVWYLIAWGLTRIFAPIFIYFLFFLF
jgi:hypothetical protein